MFFKGSPALRTPFSSVLAEGCSASITTRSLKILSWFSSWSTHGHWREDAQSLKVHRGEDIAAVRCA